jgi:hypothetical protein
MCNNSTIWQRWQNKHKSAITSERDCTTALNAHATTLSWLSKRGRGASRRIGYQVWTKLSRRKIVYQSVNDVEQKIMKAWMMKEHTLSKREWCWARKKAKNTRTSINMAGSIDLQPSYLTEREVEDCTANKHIRIKTTQKLWWMKPQISDT